MKKGHLKKRSEEAWPTEFGSTDHMKEQDKYGKLYHPDPNTLGGLPKRVFFHASIPVRILSLMVRIALLKGRLFFLVMYMDCIQR